MKISELIKHLADILVLDGDINVYIGTENTPTGKEEFVEEVLVGRKKVIITSKDYT